MRVGFLTTGGVTDRYILQEVRRVFPPVVVVRPVSSPPAPQPRAARLLRWGRAPVASLSAKLASRAREARMVRREAAAQEALFGGPPPELGARTVAKNRLNGPEHAAELRALALDVLVVAGAPLLKPAIFEVPRLGTVNLHYGIAPAYRGEDTLFWAMYEGRYDRLGVTLHTIAAGVDSGAILAQGFLGRRGGETEEQLWVAAARVGARLVVEYLQECARRIEANPKAPVRPAGRPQEAGGRQYFARERRPWHDAALRLRTQLHPLPAAEERLERFFG